MGVAQKNIHSINAKVILNDWLVPKNMFLQLSCEMVVMFSLTLLLTGADLHPRRPRDS